MVSILQLERLSGMIWSLSENPNRILLTWRGQHPCSRSCSDLEFPSFVQLKCGRPALWWQGELSPASPPRATLQKHTLTEKGVVCHIMVRHCPLLVGTCWHLLLDTKAWKRKTDQKWWFWPSSFGVLALCLEDKLWNRESGWQDLSFTKRALFGGQEK